MSPIAEVVSWMVLALLAALGFRLLRLAVRSRGLAELLVSMFFLSAALIGYGPILFVIGSFAPSPETSASLRVISAYGLAIPPSVLAIFFWRVFRPEARWAAGLAMGVTVACFYGAAMTTGAASEPGVSAPMPRWIAVAARVVAYSWGAAEAFSRWRMGRLRLELGLADALVVNRFLLWSIWCLCGLAMAASSLATAWLGRPVVGSLADQVVLWVHIVAGLGEGIASWLVFVPPAVYKRLFAASEVSEGAVEAR